MQTQDQLIDAFTRFIFEAEKRGGVPSAQIKAARESLNNFTSGKSLLSNIKEYDRIKADRDRLRLAVFDCIELFRPLNLHMLSDFQLKIYNKLRDAATVSINGEKR